MEGVLIVEPITTFTSKVVALPINDIDTDQIIPASYLKVIDKSGLGEGLFYSWRYNADGSPKQDFVLNKPEARGAQVLIAGNNFGCGSSREHAPWALHDYGFRAVVSTSIADIFRNNSLKNGIVPVVIDPSVHAKLLAAPGTEVTISVEDRTLTLPDATRATFPIEPFARYCLLNGVDELEFLLSQNDAISAFEQRRQT